mmetsp:Transcript_24113/g.40417  ORF Transcript_24113/g.40417 Transcript_24113/m.40417 type:complete len:458 (-) Transcript_24113:71-1444(-)
MRLNDGTARCRVGYLFKKGGGRSAFGRRSWKLRFFVLDATSLCYFKAEGETALKKIKLGKVVDAWIDYGTKSKATSTQYHFSVKTSSRTYQIAATGYDEAHDWVNSIRNNLDLLLGLNDSSFPSSSSSSAVTSAASSPVSSAPSSPLPPRASSPSSSPSTLEKKPSTSSSSSSTSAHLDPTEKAEMVALSSSPVGRGRSRSNPLESSSPRDLPFFAPRQSQFYDAASPSSPSTYLGSSGEIPLSTSPSAFSPSSPFSMMPMAYHSPLKMMRIPTDERIEMIESKLLEEKTEISALRSSLLSLSQSSLLKLAVPSDSKDLDFEEEMLSPTSRISGDDAAKGLKLKLLRSMTSQGKLETERNALLQQQQLIALSSGPLSPTSSSSSSSSSRLVEGQDVAMVTGSPRMTPRHPLRGQNPTAADGMACSAPQRRFIPRRSSFAVVISPPSSSSSLSARPEN